jgi:ubiquinone/menaquinone biosynthesis C-methylase UbiE
MDHLKVDVNKVVNEFDNRAENLRDENAVLDARDNPKVAHQNVFRNYHTKKTVIKYLKPTLTDVVLDFGCGVGRLSNHIAPLVKKVFGADKSTKMLKIASEINSSNKNVSYQHFNTYPLPFENKSFSKIFTYWVLQHVDNNELKDTFRDFYRILQDNGMVYLFEQVRSNESIVLDNIHHQRKREEYHELMKDAGFRFINAERVFRYPSYSLSIWSKYSGASKFLLGLLSRLELVTANRKPEHIIYSTDVLIYQKI